MRILFVSILLAININLWADMLPDFMLPLRDAIYEQKLNPEGIKSLYRSAKEYALNNYSGTALDLALSRCEYYMGRGLQDNEINDEARTHYLEGMRLAEKVIAAEPSAEAWVAMTENLSQNCSLGPWTYTVANGLNVEKYSKNALSYNKRNAVARHMIASRWVYAPSPFNNYKKGIEMMNAILTESDMDKSDYFNVYIAIAYAYVQQKKYADARPWLLKAQEIYPTNKFAAELLAKK